MNENLKAIFGLHPKSMKHHLHLLLFLVLGVVSCAQSIPDVLEKYNDHTVEYITVASLDTLNTPMLLDARELEEFEVSHLDHALWVGYTDFNVETVQEMVPDKTTPLVVYCSLGVRSEEIGKQLKKAGYTNVKNLYGGIFEWKNQGRPVYDQDQQQTEKVHAFSKYWGRFLTNAHKVYTSKTKTNGQ